MNMTEAAYLYVEDDVLGREIMRMIMHNVIGAAAAYVFEDSANFMERLRALPRKPDLIMLDIHIRPHDGVELLSMIRADAEYRHTRVIALTASVMNEEVAELRSSGFDGAIAKPLDIAVFPSLIARILNGVPTWHIA